MDTPRPPAAEHDSAADIVIAGGGLSGLSAALTAAESGVNAIVLEKQDFLGGAGLFPEGSLGIGTRFQKEHGITTTTEEVFAKAMEFLKSVGISNVKNLRGGIVEWIETVDPSLPKY